MALWFCNYAPMSTNILSEAYFFSVSLFWGELNYVIELRELHDFKSYTGFQYLIIPSVIQSPLDLIFPTLNNFALETLKLACLYIV